MFPRLLESAFPRFWNLVISRFRDSGMLGLHDHVCVDLGILKPQRCPFLVRCTLPWKTKRSHHNTKLSPPSLDEELKTHCSWGGAHTFRCPESASVNTQSRGLSLLGEDPLYPSSAAAGDGNATSSSLGPPEPGAAKVAPELWSLCRGWARGPCQKQTDRKYHPRGMQSSLQNKGSARGNPSRRSFASWRAPCYHSWGVGGANIRLPDASGRRFWKLEVIKEFCPSISSSGTPPERAVDLRDLAHTRAHAHTAIPLLGQAVGCST